VEKMTALEIISAGAQSYNVSDDKTEVPYFVRRDTARRRDYAQDATTDGIGMTEQNNYVPISAASEPEVITLTDCKGMMEQHIPNTIPARRENVYGWSPPPGAPRAKHPYIDVVVEGHGTTSGGNHLPAVARIRDARHWESDANREEFLDMILGGRDYFPAVIPIRNGVLDSNPRGRRATSSGDHISAVVLPQTDQRTVDNRGFEHFSVNVPIPDRKRPSDSFATRYGDHHDSSGGSNNMRDDLSLVVVTLIRIVVVKLLRCSTMEDKSVWCSLRQQPQWRSFPCSSACR
jgi:hypothetical protein